MARRRTKDDLFVELITTFFGIGLVVAVVFFGKQGKELVAAVYGGIVFLAGVAVILVIIKIAFLLLRKRRTPFFDPASLSVHVPDASPRVSVSTPRPTESLRRKIAALDWFQFEKLVAAYYETAGYTVERRGGAKADGGIDIIVSNQSGRVGIQCKQWKQWKVGVKVVREMIGALKDAGLERGVVVTPGRFSDDAKTLAERHSIVVIEGEQLERMLFKADCEYNPALITALSSTEKHCPKCESKMVLRTASKGLKAGNNFWGCSTFPKCRFTMAVG